MSLWRNIDFEEHTQKFPQEDPSSLGQWQGKHRMTSGSVVAENANVQVMHFQRTCGSTKVTQKLAPQVASSPDESCVGVDGALARASGLTADCLVADLGDFRVGEDVDGCCVESGGFAEAVGD